MIGDRYRSKLLIPEGGDASFPLFTKTGLQLASGYVRVVIGGRGPYVEMSTDQILMANLYRSSAKHYYYNEWRTVDEANLKLYHQMATVGYADYIVGKWYATPFELYGADGHLIISTGIPAKVAVNDNEPSIFV